MEFLPEEAAYGGLNRLVDNVANGDGDDNIDRRECVRRMRYAYVVEKPRCRGDCEYLNQVDGVTGLAPAFHE